MFDIVGPDITGKGRELIGTLHAHQNGKFNEANAALMAAAPDLLAACEEVLKAANDPDYDDYFDGARIEVMLERAIAKAKGSAS